MALVASAAKGMASKLCATPLTAVISTGATVIAYYWPKPYTFPALIGVGGLMTVGWSYYKKETLPPVKVGEVALRNMPHVTCRKRDCLECGPRLVVVHHMFTFRV